MRGIWLVVAASLLLSSCGRKSGPGVSVPGYASPTPAGYATVPVEVAGPRTTFVEVAEAAGLHFHHETGAAGAKWMPETMGSGCALFDYDGDGWLDAFLVNGRKWDDAGGPDAAHSQLFRNRGDGTFVEVTRQAGLGFSAYGMGVAVADYDADGDQDLYLTTLGDNLLLRNDGGRFVDVAGPAGVVGGRWTGDDGRQHPEWSTSAAWVDVDRDGWSDLFVANYVRWAPTADLFTTLDGTGKSYATPQPYPGSTCRLYRNLGNGSFQEITEGAGVLLPEAKSLGVAVADLDRDGWSDLVVTNDTQPNLLLHNLGNGRFEERGLAAGIGYDDAGRARAGMGVDVAALDGTGTLSIAIGNFSREPLSLYQQAGGGSYVDGAGRARLVQATLPTLTFGLRFLDFDLDGRQDLILANGHIEPEINRVQKEIQYAQPLQLFWNDGQGHLLEVSSSSGAPFAGPLVARGLAVGDVDQDGDLDVLVSTNGGAPRLLRNEGPTGSAIALRLRGRPPALDALGAVVSVRVGSTTQEQMVRTGSSYLSHSSTVIYFGLGQAQVADEIAIRWPDASEERLHQVPA
ncbi:MAG: CRTAC1 family protein, partial [Candidatus Latescibacterota bacterium]